MGIQFTGLASGIDTQSIIKDLMKAEKIRVETVKKDKILAEWKKEAWDEMNTKLYSFYKEELFDFKSTGTYGQKKLTSSNKSLITLNESKGAVRGNHTIEITTMAKGSFLTGSELVGVTASSTAEDMFGLTDPDTKTITLSVDGGTTTHDITIEASDTMSAIVDKMKDLDLDLAVSYDENFHRMFFSSTKTGQDVRVELTGDSDVLDNLGFASGSRVGTQGTRAEFIYNGTTLYSESNEVVTNGLSFNILSEGGSSTITVIQDTEAIYESVKTFVNKYNEIMKELTTSIGAKSARQYKPLTNEEKEAMTKEDIKLWETKIKASLLRRDDALTGIAKTLRDTLTLSSGVDTKDFTYKSLSDLGIVTGNYKEKGLLHIEGDPDEALYGTKDNKLRAAIEKDPDKVMELLSGLGNRVYKEFASRMKSSRLSSALTFYNDKSMDKLIKKYKQDIFDLEDKMSVIESRYYKQFTAMEQAIQQSNSTGSWLAQQLGGN